MPGHGSPHPNTHNATGSAPATSYRVDGLEFATAGKDATVRIYDETTKACTVALKGAPGYGSTKVTTLRIAQRTNVPSTIFHNELRSRETSASYPQLLPSCNERRRPLGTATASSVLSSIPPRRTLC